ncbi:MAG: glycosyltransferase family 2 protein [Candidatus Omnitrophica bacterium]|nr:glycosyltransferase family 2 protein [Candidatus Omnitrophota bacterium]
MTYDLSIVIPAYNEAKTIAATLDTVTRYLAGTSRSWEILVVNDGSRDATVAETIRAARALAPRQIRLLEHPHNRGKGAAVRTGVLASTGRFIVFYDADGATPISELANVMPQLERGAAVVTGSRRIAGAAVRRHQPWLRRALGTCYVGLTQRLIGVRVSDITCGFKALRHDAAKAIFARLRTDGWSFDAEMFWLARRLGYDVAEVPITWTDQPNTKVRMGRAVFTSLWELLRIRWAAWRGDHRAAA